MENEQILLNLVSYLNGLLLTDEESISKLLLHRVKCKKELETNCFVLECNDDEVDVSTIGVINGFISKITNGKKVIVAYVSDKDKILNFSLEDKE